MTTKASFSSMCLRSKTPQKYFRCLKDQRYIILHNYLDVDFSLASAKDSMPKSKYCEVYHLSNSRTQILWF